MTETFEAERPRLRALARRLLGSYPEAEDTLQEAWIRLAAVDVRGVGNLSAYLTTIVCRLALDVLRARRSRPLTTGDTDVDGIADPRGHADPEGAAVLAESIGIAMLVVLNRLRPAERVCFVLHDFFGLPFPEVATIMRCSPAAARQSASRGRRRVQGLPGSGSSRSESHEQAVAAFYAASREGDFEALLALLDPDAELVIDPALDLRGVERTVRGAGAIARRASGGAARENEAALAYVDGQAGIVVAPGGVLRLVMLFGLSERHIARIEVVGHRQRLDGMDLRIVASEPALHSGTTVPD